MTFFLQFSYICTALLCVIAFTASQSHAQYHIPQEKKEQTAQPEKRSFWFWNRKPKPRITYNNVQRKPKNEGERSKMEDLFPMDHDFESSMSHIDTTNRLKTPVFDVPLITDTPVSGSTVKSKCSPKQKTAIRAIQKYLDRKSKGLTLTANDKKVAAFMAIPNNVTKAQELANFCSMSLAIR